MMTKYTIRLPPKTTETKLPDNPQVLPTRYITSSCSIEEKTTAYRTSRVVIRFLPTNLLLLCPPARSFYRCKYCRARVQSFLNSRETGY